MDNANGAPRKIWRGILVLSLALNVALIGGLAGSAVSGRSKDGPPQRMSFDFGPLGRALEKEDRRAIGQAMRRGGPRPISRANMQDRIADLATALRADPFDAAQVSALIGGLQDRTRRVQENAQAAFVAHLATMPVERRHALADKLDRK